ncbi:unnamed protein product [Rotaria sp. Silwood2]|nr:unnamed protein product [Rotaria sp. Silwood2]CAF3401537.1 unnamed protein product [Rotaria sp. Silwood2]CAF4257863.1 unnamed protein product [Rotaria sp. Silwood2]CAF4393719.1 unnamed protein product [Rotaria sp. Silwood2]
MLLTSINGLMQYDFNRINQGELYPTFVPYVNNTEVDSIFIAFQAMHYAIAQFTQSMLTLDYTVHTIFELQTTHFYR